MLPSLDTPVRVPFPVESPPAGSRSLNGKFEASSVAFYALFLTIYFVLAAGAATRRLWYDELLTYHLAQLPLRRLWDAIAAGADLHPPLSHALTHLCFLLMGASEFTVRLPSIIAFATMCLC